MTRIRPFLAIASMGFALVACAPADVGGETGTPTIAPVSPATSPVASPATSPDVSPMASPSPSETLVSPPPAATPVGSPGATTEIPFEPGGSAELGGTVTLTEYGSTTQVVVEFNSFQLPATSAVAMLKVGSCETAELLSAGALEVVDGRIEGTVPLSMDDVTELPHAVVVLESVDAAEPLVCIDTTLPEGS